LLCKNEPVPGDLRDSIIRLAHNCTVNLFSFPKTGSKLSGPEKPTATERDD